MFRTSLKYVGLAIAVTLSSAAFAQESNQYQSSYELQVQPVSNSNFNEGTLDGIASLIKVFEDQACRQSGNMKIEMTPEGSFTKELGREVGLVNGRTAKVSGILLCTGSSKLIRASVVVARHIADKTHSNIQVVDVTQNRIINRYSFVGQQLQ